MKNKGNLIGYALTFILGGVLSCVGQYITDNVTKSEIQFQIEEKLGGGDE